MYLFRENVYPHYFSRPLWPLIFLKKRLKVANILFFKAFKQQLKITISPIYLLRSLRFYILLLVTMTLRLSLKSIRAEAVSTLSWILKGGCEAVVCWKDILKCQTTLHNTLCWNTDIFIGKIITILDTHARCEDIPLWADLVVRLLEAEHDSFGCS